MAELRQLSEFEYSQHSSGSEDDGMKKREPKKYKKVKKYNITRLEKVVAVLAVFVFLSACFGLITVRNSLIKERLAITQAQSEITTLEGNIDELQQEKSELSRVDRLKEIAKEAGLTINDDNIRKVEE